MNIELQNIAFLIDKSAVFRRTIDLCDDIIGDQLGWSLKSSIDSACAREIDITEDRIEPVMTSVQVSLCTLLESFDFSPSSVLCLSGGEFAAASACKAIQLSDSLRLVCQWAQATTDGIGAGSTISVAAACDVAMQIASETNVPVYLASDMTQRLSLLSTSTQNAEFLIELFSHYGIQAMPTPFRAGYHSPLMKEWQPYAERVLATIDIGKPLVPLFSAATGGQQDSLNIDHWFNVIAGPAYFRTAALASLDAGHSSFLEINICQNLSSQLEEIGANISAAIDVIPILKLEDNSDSLLGRLGIVP